jgi:TatD DNase family protein
MSRSDAEKTLLLVRQFPEMCKMTLGGHPYHTSEIYDGKSSDDGSNSYLESLREMGEALLAEKDSPLAAFGEIGLDYVYLDRADKPTQQRAFQDQLGLAAKLQLPLFLHFRESTDDFISIQTLPSTTASTWLSSLLRWF